VDLDRKKLARRAERARKKARAGEPLSEREQAAITEWQGLRSKAGRKPKLALVPPTVDSASGEGTEAGPEAGESAPATAPPPAVADATPIPKVLGTVTPAKGAAIRDWREQYRITGMGREATCVQVAAFACGLLERANKVTKELGYTPLIDDEMLQLRQNPDGSRTVGMVYASLVLCTDTLLPQNLELSPEVVAGGCAGVALGQAFYAKRKGPAEGKPTELKSVPAPLPFTAPPPPEPAVVEERPPRVEDLVTRGQEPRLPPGQNF
jgi:hypothetical protein